MKTGSRVMVLDADRRFPVHVRIAVPVGGFGHRLDGMHDWLNATGGADGWLIAPDRLRGVVNDAVAVYFRGAALATGFVRGGVASGSPRSPRARS